MDSFGSSPRYVVLIRYEIPSFFWNCTRNEYDLHNLYQPPHRSERNRAGANAQDLGLRFIGRVHWNCRSCEKRVMLWMFYTRPYRRVRDILDFRIYRAAKYSFYMDKVFDCFDLCCMVISICADCDFTQCKGALSNLSSYKQYDSAFGSVV